MALLAFARKEEDTQVESPLKTAVALVEELLHDNTARYEHTYGVHNNVLENINLYGRGLSVESKSQLTQAALLHDIGYSEGLNKVGFHPIDGFNYLKEKGFDDTVCKLVLYHSYSDVLCMMSHPNLYYYYIENTLDSHEKFLLDMLSLSDLTSDSQGHTVSLETRLQGILERHGDGLLYIHAEIAVSYLKYLTDGGKG